MKFNFLIILGLLLCSCKHSKNLSRNGQLISVDNFGAKANGQDDRQAIQKALDTGGTVVFSKKTYSVDVAYPYSCLQPSNNQKIIIPEGCTIKMINGDKNSAIFRCHQRKNVTFEGGGLLVGHKGQGYEKLGIHHGILFGDNITIKNLQFKDFGRGAISMVGDNIHCENLTIDGCAMNGMAVTNGNNILLLNITVRNTKHPDPELNVAGIDIEPDINQSIKNIKVYNYTSFNNHVGLYVQSGHGVTSDVELEKIKIDQSREVGIIISGNKTNLRNITLSEAIVSDSKNSGIVVSNCTSGTFKDIISKQNDSDGFKINNCDGITLNNVLLLENKEVGIEVRNGTKIKLKDITAADNKMRGIIITKSKEVTCQKIQTKNNYQEGIYASNSERCTIFDSEISGNGQEANKKYNNISIEDCIDFDINNNLICKNSNYISGEISSATANSIRYLSDQSISNKDLNEKIIYIISGIGKGQQRKIKKINSEQKSIDLEVGWDIIPVAGSTFEIVGERKPLNGIFVNDRSKSIVIKKNKTGINGEQLDIVNHSKR